MNEWKSSDLSLSVPKPTSRSSKPSKRSSKPSSPSPRPSPDLDFDKFKRAVFEEIASTVFPLYRKVFSLHWASSVTNLMPRVCCYSDCDEGLFAYSFPVVRDGDLVHQVFVVKIVPELNKAKCRAVAVEAKMKALANMDVPGRIGGVSVYVVAPRYERFARFKFIEAEEKQDAFWTAVIARNPKAAALRALRWWTSYLCSRLDGLVSKLSCKLGLSPWKYVPNQLERLLRASERGGPADPPGAPRKSVRVAALHYMSSLYNRVHELSSRACAALATSMRCLYETVQQLLDRVLKLMEEVAVEELAERIARAVEAHVVCAVGSARCGLGEVARRAEELLSTVKSIVLERARRAFLERESRIASAFLERLRLASPS